MEKRKVIHHSEVANETSRSTITTYEDGEIVISFQQLQLDRVENKMDRILELLENKELSISSKEGFLNKPKHSVTYTKSPCCCVENH
ncbi:hypothetical protein [Cytobacillus horneckiae]|uniref:hypothetical protein n=1 Tax=Cytobacillus horneckiae TaxID=549687 RepID=UPI003D9A9E33